jgi:hypothetical protein
MLQKFKQFVLASTLAVLAVVGGSLLSVNVANATGTGLADGVTTYISGANTDMVTIGVAVLGVLVIIAAIGWTVRAMRK